MTLLLGGRAHKSLWECYVSYSSSLQKNMLICTFTFQRTQILWTRAKWNSQFLNIRPLCSEVTFFPIGDFFFKESFKIEIQFKYCAMQGLSIVFSEFWQMHTHVLLMPLSRYKISRYFHSQMLPHVLSLSVSTPTEATTFEGGILVHMGSVCISWRLVFQRKHT